MEKKSFAAHGNRTGLSPGSDTSPLSNHSAVRMTAHVYLASCNMHHSVQPQSTEDSCDDTKDWTT